METPANTPTAIRSVALAARGRNPHGIRSRGFIHGLLPCLLLLAAACTGDTGEGPITELEEVTADQILYGTAQSLTRGGVQEGLLEADSIYMWDDSTHVRIFGLRVLLYDERGREKGRVTAEGGRLSDVARELWAYGNALLSVPADELSEARDIFADELFFDLDGERIWTGVPVRMQRGDCQVLGDGFDSDLSFNNLTIEAPRDGGCSEP